MVTQPCDGLPDSYVCGERYRGDSEEGGAMFTWTIRCAAASVTTSNEVERMPRIRNGTFRRMNLVVLAFMSLGAPLAQAQDSLEDFQKRKAMAEAEKEAIQAETARDEARQKQSDLVAPLDRVDKANDDAAKAANSAGAKADADKAQSEAQSLCQQCLKATRDMLKKCIEGAISQEDKKSCAEKQQSRAKRCEIGECKIAREHTGKSHDVLPETK